MNVPELAQGLASFLCFILIITVHEFGHAWMANRCGDDTSRLLGRVTLNPAAHIDLFGTILLPLLAVFLAATGSGQLASFVIGWGKPVPVNIGNLRHRVRDDILVTMAGPAMNVVITMAVLIVGRVALAAGWDVVVDATGQMAMLSMFLFFFNLIPVPPLDGSRVMRHIVGMGEEAFMHLSRFGMIILIIVVQIQQVREALALATVRSVGWMAKLAGFGG